MKYKDILLKYLEIFPNEKTRQEKFMEYLNYHTENQVIDWNNFNGHIVASGFIYAVKEKKFLALYHKDLNMFLYPGGHIEKPDKDILYAAKREVKEETGLQKLEHLNISRDETVPIDIDTHKIPYNSRLDLPEHYHFDFRYLFTVNEIKDIKIDDSEHSEYKWIDITELCNDKNYGKVATKIIEIIDKTKMKD